ncbi:putative membrane protein [Sulfitobacter noctilucicola]|uniref:DUF998 domain-containing protein n=1 Tax=Sulfitobacter noctilucicola TaxID=1342301 RepID=A0A7W6M8I5_9RHOB|nr:DUF998 domain-containing protein [Sulfitobacter noctilucicola]KIN62090.1 putative membrane protein [Sulfitobacter noctilucicola]MBB4173391.1 hypothetical protein [Sulfitobacter noctilucicola]
MPHDDHQYPAPGFIAILWWLAILGAVGLIGGNIAGSIIVPGHDFMADTVSDLAAGRYEIIQDISLYGFAVSLFALALAAAYIHDGSGRWSILVFSLALLAALVIIIGARNEYGDNDSDGVVIHIYLVYALGALFAVAFGISALEGNRVAPWFGTLSLFSLIIWAVGAPVFFIMPTAYDGVWERGLGVITIIWTIAFALGLRRYSRVRRADTR